MGWLNKQIIKNASVVIAGGACLLTLFAYLVFPGHSFVEIHGFYHLAGLAVPLLCFWVGMLVRCTINKHKMWIRVIGILAMITFYYFSSISGYYYLFTNELLQDCGLILLGLILPWEYLLENRDKEGIRSIILLIISALAFAVISLVNDRMRALTLPLPFEDLDEFLLSITYYVLPVVVSLPIYFAAQFALSNPGQWLGSQKWFLWVSIVAAVLCFIAAVLRLRFFFTPNDLYLYLVVLVQPITVQLIYLIVKRVKKSLAHSIKEEV